MSAPQRNYVPELATSQAIFNEPRSPAGELRRFGLSFQGTPRGTPSRWTVIRDDRSQNHQAVVPRTWNAGRRDESYRIASHEAALIGNPIADPARPLEALRMVDSFDPCLAAAIHTVDGEGQEIARVKAL